MANEDEVSVSVPGVVGDLEMSRGVTHARSTVFPPALDGLSIPDTAFWEGIERSGPSSNQRRRKSF